jgi:hypothetical protein
MPRNASLVLQMLGLSKQRQQREACCHPYWQPGIELQRAKRNVFALCLDWTCDG